MSVAEQIIQIQKEGDKSRDGQESWFGSESYDERRRRMNRERQQRFRAKLKQQQKHLHHVNILRRRPVPKRQDVDVDETQGDEPSAEPAAQTPSPGPQVDDDPEPPPSQIPQIAVTLPSSDAQTDKQNFVLVPLNFVIPQQSYDQYFSGPLQVADHFLAG